MIGTGPSAAIYLGDVERLLMTNALALLDSRLSAEVEQGARNGHRSQEYERLREIINGGATYGRGLLARLGCDGTPKQIEAAWQPIVAPVPP